MPPPLPRFYEVTCTTTLEQKFMVEAVNELEARAIVDVARLSAGAVTCGRCLWSGTPDSSDSTKPRRCANCGKWPLGDGDDARIVRTFQTRPTRITYRAQRVARGADEQA